MSRYYTTQEEVTLRFYQMPKSLFNNPRYKGLSLAAKAMYSILRDRQDLSIKNNWVDENNYIYLVFGEFELAELLETTEKTARGYKKELVKYGLLVDKRMGRGMTNHMYVLKPELSTISPQSTNVKSIDTSKNGKNDRSRTVKTTGPERYNLPSNDTDFNETHKNKLNEFPFYNWLENDN